MFENKNKSSKDTTNMALRIAKQFDGLELRKSKQQ